VECTVDGTRDRPPGKVAENWSRKDHIRAGAVSGPWRSAPRTEASPLPAEPPEARRLPAERLSRRSARMAAWIAFGILFAAGCVLAAFLLRPQHPVPPEAPAEIAAPSPAEVAAPPAPEADPALAAIGGVRLRTGPDLPAEQRDAIVAALRAAGIGAVRVEALPFKVATSRVGYYRAADLPAAEALARLIAPVLAVEGPIAVRDYGQLLADPEPGRLDLWVGG
jgi:hypothetical protein